MLSFSFIYLVVSKNLIPEIREMQDTPVKTVNDGKTEPRDEVLLRESVATGDGSDTDHPASHIVIADNGEGLSLGHVHHDMLYSKTGETAYLNHGASLPVGLAAPLADAEDGLAGIDPCGTLLPERGVATEGVDLGSLPSGTVLTAQEGLTEPGRLSLPGMALREHLGEDKYVCRLLLHNLLHYSVN